MAFSVGDLIAHIKADVSDFKKGIAEAKDSAGGFTKTMQNMVSTSQSLAKGIAVAGAAAGAAMLVFGKQSVEAAAGAQVEMAKVDALLSQTAKSMEKTTVVVKGNSGAIKEQTKAIDNQIATLNRKLDVLELSGQAESGEAKAIKENIRALKLQKVAVEDTTVVKDKSYQVTNKNALSQEKLREEVDKTAASFIKLGFDDEATSLAMAKSLAVTKNVAETNKEMGLAADFARLKSIGIAEAQGLLQMAYMGNQRVLKQYGIELSDTATKAEIFAAVEKVAGGQAEAFAETYQGKLEMLKVTYGNLQEEVGGRLLPVLTQLMDWILNVAIPNITNFTNVVKENKNIIIAVAIGITAMLIPALIAAIPPMVAFALNVVIATAPLIIMGAVVAGLAYLIITHWTEIVNWTKWLMEQIVTYFENAGTYLKGWAEVVKLTISNAWNSMVNTLQNIGRSILDAIMWPFEEAKRKIDEAVKYIKDRLDFTKRHSPSVLDIVQRGVGLVNNALSELPSDINIGTNVALAGATASGTTNQMAVTVDMAGAVIGDMSQAQRLAETVGDTIIKRLKLNVRF